MNPAAVMPLVPVILSGGVGARLWPVSREATPKPFMKVGGDTSLLRRTFDRARALPGTVEVLTVTNREFLGASLEQYEGSGLAGTFILEPFGRNTAAAIVLAALRAAEAHGESAILVVLPADHLITNQAAFANDVAVATQLAQRGLLVTFGIVPDHPETGYGYIELGEPIAGTRGFAVAKFVEKPYREIAEKYVASGRHLWNAGLFCFSAGALLAAAQALQPELVAAVRACWQDAKARTQQGWRVFDIAAEGFGRVPEISIDFGVMERASDVAVVRATFDWSDIGSWSAIHDALASDAEGNSVVGEAVLVDVHNSHIQTCGRVVAAVGVNNLIVVDTPDAVLVADRGSAQGVKTVVERLRRDGHEAVTFHRTVSRPWGSFTTIDHGEGFKIKRIVVKPGQSLSLQRHQKRSEHWVVVSGKAQVTRALEEATLGKNQSTYIPMGEKHRLANTGDEDLVIIEVQCGDYLGEDDIERFEDVYGRA